MRIAIRGGHLLDPAHAIDGVNDLYIAGRCVISIGHAPAGFTPEVTINAHGQIVCPGLIDLCARLREPGLEHKATLLSETRAAASAGITTLVCPPDTDPVVDETAVVRLIRRRADTAGFARVLPLGALTQGLRGEQLAEMAALKEAGCVGVSNGLFAMTNTLVLRRALEYAATFDLTVFLGPQDPWLSRGAAHDGQVAARLGLTGIPTAAETAIVARDLALIEDCGVRAHFGRLSAARSLELIAEAQARGLQVTADVAAHQLHLTEFDIGHFDSRCHTLPPLRTQRDMQGLRAGLAEGVLAAVCSDHQPHEADAKDGPFSATEPGISGLETLLALTLRLVHDGVLPLATAVERLTWGPARVLGLDSGHLGIGAPADICIFDPDTEWSVEASAWLSRGSNTPFLGWPLKGRVTHTLLGGRLVFKREAV